MKEKIPPARVILYSILGCLTIVLCSLFWMVSTINRTKNAREELLLLGEKIQLKASEQETNRRIMAQYQGKDALFLHKKLESLPLLSSEIELLKTKVAISALPEDIVLEKRLQQLTSGENDLFKILSLLEGPQGEEESRPHCIISEARLDRKKTVVHEEWTLSLNIVRREYML
jgi:hypothetical protein